MVFEHGDVSRLSGQDWYMIEIRADRSGPTEQAVRRLCRAIPKIFGKEPCELFVPVMRRDLDVFELAVGSYLFIHGSLKNAGRCYTVTGVMGLVTTDSEAEYRQVKHAIPVEDAYVQSLIAQCKDAWERRAEGTREGSFVRIIGGETRDYCGTVTAIEGTTAVVRIETPNRIALVETPTRNLLRLDDVPQERRVYYYSPASMQAEPEAIAPDMRYVEEPMLDESEYVKPDYNNPQWKQSQTITRHAAAFATPGTEPLHVAEILVERIREGKVKPTKNLTILYNVIKNAVAKAHGHKDWHEARREHRHWWKFTPQAIAAIAGDLGIPIRTGEPCNDGRKHRSAKLTDLCGRCGHERKHHGKRKAWRYRCAKCECQVFRRRS